MVAFASSPDGAEIMIGGKIVGTTPVTLELPCKPNAAFFKRDRYQTLTRHFEPRPGEEISVSGTLERPSFTVTIVSAPPGAKIMMGGNPVGTTPGKVTVPGFEGTPVELVKAGFQPHRERVYASKNGQRVEVRLRRK